MILKSLYLQQFRNYRDAYFEFNPSLNLICGPNAQGKTSLLEAIYYLMFGRSFRPGLHQDLIHKDFSSFYLEATFCKQEIEQKLSFSIDGKERKIIYNNTVLPNITHLLGIIQGVVMTPDDVNLIKGAPSIRRQFLDTQLAQVNPLYVHYLARYNKAMRHRNQLLKQNSQASIESWEHEMAHAASYIVQQRRRCLSTLNIHCQAYYHTLSGEGENLNLKYLSPAANFQQEGEIKAFYLHQFDKYRPREIILGHTLAGPHKDDIQININERDARFFASEGEQRSSVAALHVGEWKCLKEQAETTPLFMIDDATMSLDGKRRKKLLEQLSEMGQVFLTTTETDLAHFFSGSKSVFLLPFEKSSFAV